MGSLPNLHELADKEDEPRDRERGRLAEARASCSQCRHCNHNHSHHKHKHPPPPPGHAGHRSHHPPLLKTKSAGSQQHNCIGSIDRPDEDSILERMASYSPISNRSSRSNSTLHHHQLHNAYAATPGPGACSTTAPTAASTSRIRGDSMSSSAGNSSVRKLIAVVRSTPSKYGPIYSRKVLCRNFGALCLGHMLITAALVPSSPSRAPSPPGTGPATSSRPSSPRPTRPSSSTPTATTSTPPSAPAPSRSTPTSAPPPLPPLPRQHPLDPPLAAHH
ncbi:unnamed protein product [Bemisia tabaci]|uniref:Uncharacterized protein n=1 Tax=Bemisia tabaci TaxID=7038 RepID=A0A9P0AJD9_BEMTA|nr:unnamed protein product [Bemisia tabaci]